MPIFSSIFPDCINRKLSGIPTHGEKLISLSDSVLLHKRSITWSQLLASTETSKNDGSKKKGSTDTIGKADTSESKQVASTSPEDASPPDPDKQTKGKENKGKVHFFLLDFGLVNNKNE